MFGYKIIESQFRKRLVLGTNELFINYVKQLSEGLWLRLDAP